MKSLALHILGSFILALIFGGVALLLPKLSILGSWLVSHTSPFFLCVLMLFLFFSFISVFEWQSERKWKKLTDEKKRMRHIRMMF